MSILTPASTRDLAQMVKEATDSGATMDIAGGGTRSGLGRTMSGTHVLSVRALSGITLYEPAELVMGAMAGTPLAVIEAELADRGQMLPFEPMDHRALYGTTGEPTIGGVFAANISGPRRLSAGAARDHLIGITLVNGRGETVRNGGRVMKNVTGLDLVKLSAGAMGTLGVMTNVVFKVLPRPETSVTLIVEGDEARAASGLMTRAMGTSCDVSAAAFLPGTGTLLRLEGFAASVTERLKRLRGIVGGGVAQEDDAALWRGIGNVSSLVEGVNEVWRLSVAPSQARTLLPRLEEHISGLVLDWSGGLIWVSAPEEARIEDLMRPLAAEVGGHATMIRASARRRSSVPVYQPLSEPLMRLSAGVKASFDPSGIFNPGRMYEDY